ncbi:MAG: DnaD domain protein [Lachnospiraceae bacterium]|nr:DnaD domain protein [Lachnospiraceae bacterium]
MSRLTLYKDNLTESTIVSNQFIDEYMKDANDAQIKIYLYLLRMMSSNLPTSISDIADKFNHTEKDVTRALAYWEKQNLLCLDYDEKGEICGLHMKSASAPAREAQIVPMPKVVPTPVTTAPEPAPTRNAAPKPAPPSFEKPSYSLDEVSAFKMEEETSQILFVAESYLGRTLSVVDVKSLLFIYKELKFSTDLMDYLIEYCVGKGKREMRYIEKVAVNWASEGVVTVRQAKNRSTRYEKLVYTVMKALGRQSEPTTQEADYIQRWNKQYGFSQDVILAACEKTVLAVDSHRFEYTEGILSKWHKSGIHTLNDIKKAEEAFQNSKNSRPASKPNAKPVNTFNNFSQQRDYDFNQLERELFSN